MRKIKQLPAQSPQDRGANKIARYLQFPTIDGDDNPLQWWYLNMPDDIWQYQQVVPKLGDFSANQDR
jgi:hypothetical protein